jgi:hypothetical protein
MLACYSKFHKDRWVHPSIKVFDQLAYIGIVFPTAILKVEYDFLKNKGLSVLKESMKKFMDCVGWTTCHPSL